tara:strand:- start:441 stop:812 length:372 start_codon:yes stop_codon:yes gene_type:complete
MLDVPRKMGIVKPPLSGFFCLWTFSYVLMCKKETYILYPFLLNLIVSIDQEYLWEVLNYVWEDGLTELEVQKKYFSILEKELKGEDRLYLETVYKTIEELELKDSQAYVPKNKYQSLDSIIKK